MPRFLVPIQYDRHSTTVVAATGHRPPRLGLAYTPEHNRLLTMFAVAGLKRLTAEGDKLVAISGVAQGWDQAFAHASLLLNIPLVCAVPFDGQEAKWPDDAKRRYQAILSKATRVVTVCPGRYSAKKFIERDHWMADRADLMLALWDGEKAGGTWETIRYAESVGVEVANAWGNWLKFKASPGVCSLVETPSEGGTHAGTPSLRATSR